MATPLVHTALRDKVLNLRLVKLHPATDATDTLKLDVEEHTRASAPPYEALSYAWGADDAGGSVSISNQTVAVSETVETALRHLRLESVPRWLWIDQLCINQVDDAEKSHQVGQMHHIYAEATQAVAWIGLGDDEVGFLFHKIKETAELIDQDDVETLEKIYHPSHNEGADTLRRVSRAFDDLCARTYWSRIWIVQELTVARHVIIVCGKHSIDAETITKLFFQPFLPKPRFPGDGLDGGQTGSVEQYQLRYEAIIAARLSSLTLCRHIRYVYQTLKASYVRWLLVQRYNWWRSNLDWGDPVENETRASRHKCLLDVMVMSQVPWTDYCFRGATDDRDRVFAMLNLASDREQFSEFPDYSISAVHTYYLFTRRCLELGHHQVLGYNQFPKRMDSLPSWVPDWSGPNVKPMSWHIAFPTDGLAEDNVLCVTFPRAGVLEIKGAVFDVVESLGPVWTPDWTVIGIDHIAADAYLDGVEAFCRRLWQEDVEQHMWRVMRPKTVNMPSPDGGWNYLVRHIRDHAALEREERASGQLGTGEPPCKAWFCKILRNLTPRRSFFTVSGQLGVSVPQIEVGDELCGFSGTRIPYLLRGVGNGEHVLVGEAHVEDKMNGELFREAAEVAWRTFVLV